MAHDAFRPLTKAEKALVRRMVEEKVQTLLDEQVAKGLLERHPTEPDRYRDIRHAGTAWE